MTCNARTTYCDAAVNTELKTYIDTAVNTEIITYDSVEVQTDRIDIIALILEQKDSLDLDHLIKVIMEIQQQSKATIDATNIDTTTITTKTITTFEDTENIEETMPVSSSQEEYNLTDDIVNKETQTNTIIYTTTV
ncbi:23899_t:CDS:1 [Entrophospora sp. SA101]|nr:23899_t:CDS:1 [Entrophospora sp. SA101]CAJ0861611.1 16800_t:CDS:1 [Entrophospora sp. SA101]